jgi:negative regulator of flagellin synthesis FlgM
MASRVAGEGAAPTDVRANKARETGKLGAGEYAKSAKRVDAPAAEVSISPRARELAAATRAVRETPDVREDKVEHYKKLIQNGEYKVDAGKVADGIAREAIRDDLSSEPEIALA